MNWETLDWEALDRLREGFLNGGAAVGPYWQSPSDLADYDLTFGERIGWKWDSVLSELIQRGWRPATRTVLDWGCGSGVAGRRVLRAFGSASFDRLAVHDHSPHAEAFALARARAEFPNLTVQPFAGDNEPVGLLVISHVLNELAPPAREQLAALIQRASAVLWVEPGTHTISRDLGGWRERSRSHFRVVAPCPHGAACGMFAPGNERHWCHFFAHPPGEIFSDPNWVRFGQRAGIDLRSLPYAFLALEVHAQDTGTAALPEGTARIIGRPEPFKGYTRFLSCDETGLNELELQKRTDPALCKHLKRATGIPLYRWTRTGQRIATAESLFPEA